MWVVICFQISIFEPLNTAQPVDNSLLAQLWFAFKLVSLSHWIQPALFNKMGNIVVICFQISIFEPLNTAQTTTSSVDSTLWFAFKLVSLSHWIQLEVSQLVCRMVVICFQISIFEPLNTAPSWTDICAHTLWFAFKLVSLSHWIQPKTSLQTRRKVVICFQISIFEPLNTAYRFTITSGP